MTSGQDLLLQKQEKLKQLDAAIDALPRLAQAAAEAKRIYRIAYRKQLLMLKEEGEKASTIEKMCNGDEEIALLEFKCSVADSHYDTAKEYINILKIEVKLIGEAEQREWSVSK